MKSVEQKMRSCTQCPRKCGANRLNGQTGVCGQTAELKVARADLHMWEEPCISGTRGSGAVFFSGCGLGCVFCQNHNIAAGNAGKNIPIERLAEIFLELQDKGANNINLVTAGHFIPQVIAALDLAKAAGLHLPIVYNSSGYEEVDALRQMDGYVDIYLPDLKYVDPALSKRYSHATDYFEKAKAAIAEMFRQVGKPQFQEEAAGMEMVQGENARLDVAEYQRRSEEGEALVMTKGMIVRHLLLPGCAEDSRNVLQYLLHTYGEDIFISILNQYTPLPHVSKYPELMRTVTPKEYEDVLDYAIDQGIENGFIQEGEAAQESFIPEFDGKGV